MYRLNARNNPFTLDAVTEDYLKKLYAPHNMQLYSLLSLKGYPAERMPTWLKESNEKGNST